MSSGTIGDLLAASHRTASDIAREAIFAADRCNWVGAAVREGAAGQVIVDYRALDESVYEGTSGIGLYLAEVAHATGDSELAATARAALHQALDRTGERPATLSYYVGTLGVLLVAGRAARLLDADDISARCQGQMPRLANAPVPDGFDLLNGAAGAAAGLIALHRETGDPCWVHRAAACCDHLLERSTVSGSARSWANPTIPSTGHLTGLSHGATGAAFALGMTYQVTGVERYRAATGEALHYESALFDAAARNWPDLRRSPSAAPSGGGPHYATFWCHGAPGMALARLRLLPMLDADLVRETEDAFIATSESLEYMLENPFNYCLCHGIAGNADVLLEAHRLAPQLLNASIDQELPTRAAVAGCARYQAQAIPWPSGLHGGLSPSLFLGSAGIGRLLHRLHDDQLPTILLAGL